jgi:type I site-specific restriction endonuclease
MATVVPCGESARHRSNQAALCISCDLWRVLERPVVTEADTCRTYVLPALYAAGWTDEQIREQVSFTPGRIIVSGATVCRGKRKRADYLLSYLRDRPLAVVEAKPEYRLAGDGLQQAKDYAEILDLKFAYSTNGPGIVEHDYTTGLDSELDRYPSPDELWRRDCFARGSIRIAHRCGLPTTTSPAGLLAITRTYRSTVRPRRS